MSGWLCRATRGSWDHQTTSTRWSCETSKRATSGSTLATLITNSDDLRRISNYPVLNWFNHQFLVHWKLIECNPNQFCQDLILNPLVSVHHVFMLFIRIMCLLEFDSIKWMIKIQIKKKRSVNSSIFIWKLSGCFYNSVWFLKNFRNFEILSDSLNRLRIDPNFWRFFK